MGMGDHAESCSCSWPPNNSLKPWTNAPAHYAGRLTRRAALSGRLALPAGEAGNPCASARFRRAA
jgi:hypothetical protein